jgi:hypothetical protein
MRKLIIFAIITLGVFVAMPAFCDTIYMSHWNKYYALSPSAEKTTSYVIYANKMTMTKEYDIIAVLDWIDDSIPAEIGNKSLSYPYVKVEIQNTGYKYFSGDLYLKKAMKKNFAYYDQKAATIKKISGEGEKKTSWETILSGIMELIAGVLFILAFFTVWETFKENRDLFINIIINALEGIVIGVILFAGYSPGNELSYFIGLSIICCILLACLFEGFFGSFFTHIIIAVFISIAIGVMASSWILFGVMLLIFVLSAAITFGILWRMT